MYMQISMSESHEAPVWPDQRHADPLFLRLNFRDAILSVARLQATRQANGNIL